MRSSCNSGCGTSSKFSAPCKKLPKVPMPPTMRSPHWWYLWCGTKRLWNLHFTWSVLYTWRENSVSSKIVKAILKANPNFAYRKYYTVLFLFLSFFLCDVKIKCLVIKTPVSQPFREESIRNHPGQFVSVFILSSSLKYTVNWCVNNILQTFCCWSWTWTLRFSMK